MGVLNKNKKNGWIQPIELLTHNRIDIIYKLLYVFYKKLLPEFSSQIYKQHLSIITNGLFKESDQEKKGLDSYLKSFNQVLKSINNKGFDPDISSVPLSNGHSVVNGAHRVAASIYLNKKVFCTNTSNPISIYNYKYFRDRGLDNQILEFGVLKYIELKSNVFLALIWPSANKKINYLQSFSNVIYEKKFKLNQNGAHNFLAQVYKEQKWIGGFENGYGGSYVKLSQSFKNFSPVHAIFFHHDSIKEVNEIKSDLRKKFKIKKASIHITDNDNETLDLAKYILNKNSIHFLNNAKPYLYKSLFNKLKSLKKNLKYSKININDVVIDDEGVLSIYGIRDFKNFTYFKKNDIIEENDNRAYNQNPNDLIFNPKLHFYFNDFKFTSLNEIKKMKENRQLCHDSNDIKIIQKKIQHESWSFLIISNTLFLFKAKIVAFLIPVSKKLKFYNIAKWVYKRVF